MRPLIVAAILLIAAWPSGSRAVVPDQAAMDWLVQKVCAAPSGTAIAVDPYDCPKNKMLRPLKAGELLPYHKHDQPRSDRPAGAQQHDSYPVRTPGGKILVVNPFDYPPFDAFDPAGDGYDLFRVEGDWVSVGETRDGAGFSTTFFGAACTPYNGWVFFPVSEADRPSFPPGSAMLPISGDHWEHNGETWPGTCPARYQTRSQTSWEFIKAYPFGGIGGNPVKPMDTIRSVHGYSTNPQFRVGGHMEVFYFTKIYGGTRWESWTAPERVRGSPQLLQKAAAASRTCRNTENPVYRGQEYVVLDCRDWSAVTVSSHSAAPAVWPVPDLNLLQNYHFADGLSAWTKAGSSGWELRNSTVARDAHGVQKRGQGVRYVAVSCGNACGSAMLSQNLKGAGEGKYAFAATARSESGEGKLHLTLSALDRNGKTVAEKTLIATVSSSGSRFDGADSIVRSSRFVHDMLAVQTKPDRLRLTIAPAAPGTYDIVDAWVMRTD